MCVGNDDDVRQVALDEVDGAITHMPAGSMLVDHTTASQEIALEMAEACQSQGKTFLDAPVSGGQAGAENGALTVMVGGSEADFARAEPLFDCFAKKSALLGPVGAGQLTKMVNQICIAGVLQGLSEALHLAKRSELDLDKVFDAISGGAAQSWQMENRWKTMAKGEFDFGFAVDWMRKDLGLAIDEGTDKGATLKLAELVDGYYAEVQAMGGARQDTSSLVRRLEE